MIKTFTVDNKKIDLEAERAFEIYYDILWKKMPKYMIEIGSGITGKQEQEAKDGIGKGLSSGGSGEGDGKGEAGDGTYKQIEGEEKSDKKGGGGDKKGKVNIPMPMDSHESWGAGSDNKEMAHEKIKEMVKKSLHAVKEKNKGNMPAWLKSLIDECLEHKTITWKSELRRFYGFREFSNFIPTRKRLNRRYGVTFPGYKVKRKAHMVVATDSSGSVSDEDFAKFWKEIGMMFKAGVTVTHVEIDMHVTHVQQFKRKPPTGKGIKRYGYGGTDFRPLFKFVEKGKCKNPNGEKFELKGKIDGIIYLTDGYGTFPNKVPCPTIWVMTPDHSTNGWSPKLGKVIVMED